VRDHRPRPLVIPGQVKADARVLFLAKHALAGGGSDRVDGNHAVYHHEMLTTLQAIGLRVTPADSFDAIYERPAVDFVVPLLNRAGFQNSEMLGPLLLARHRIPYLGATPILRGLSDDKHLMKVAARHHGVPTAPWAIYRIGAETPDEPPFRNEPLIVKPNASSASWGLHIVETWSSARHAVASLHAQGHDAIVEAWVPELDVAVPVIGGTVPALLPSMAYLPPEGRRFRSYEEKRALSGGEGDDPLVPVEDRALKRRLEALTLKLCRELWPFDYGRFEFRYDPASGQLRFMEVNLSCNLWSKKTISRAAGLVGMDHANLVETIVGYSMLRQGLLSPESVREAA
jgi:D-alanine-D-alanine ligase